MHVARVLQAGAVLACSARRVMSALTGQRAIWLAAACVQRSPMPALIQLLSLPAGGLPAGQPNQLRSSRNLQHSNLQFEVTYFARSVSELLSAAKGAAHRLFLCGWLSCVSDVPLMAAFESNARGW